MLAMFRTTTPGHNNSVLQHWWNATGIMAAELSGVHNDWGLKLLADGRAQGGFRYDSYAAGNVVDGKVHTTAMTWDGATGQADFYIDGAWQGTFTQGAGTVSPSGFGIATNQENGTGAFFTGDIAVLQLYTSIENVDNLHRLLVGGTYGSGCQGSNGIPKLAFTGESRIGKTLNVDLSSAPPATGAFLNAGFTNTAPYPLDLSSLGALGCMLYNEPFDTGVAGTNATGDGQISIAIPATSGLVGVRAFFQWLCLDPSANSIGLTTTNGGIAVIGT